MNNLLDCQQLFYRTNEKLSTLGAELFVGSILFNADEEAHSTLRLLSVLLVNDMR
jgi:hypothetical protein